MPKPMVKFHIVFTSDTEGNESTITNVTKTKGDKESNLLYAALAALKYAANHRYENPVLKALAEKINAAAQTTHDELDLTKF